MEARVNPRSGAARLDRAQLVVLGALLGLAAVALLVTNERMGGMESMPGMDLGALGSYATVWVVMMVAMMFPAIAPAALTYERLRQGLERVLRPGDLLLADEACATRDGGDEGNRHLALAVDRL